jgi:hypothetical protein
VKARNNVGGAIAAVALALALSVAGGGVAHAAPVHSRAGQALADPTFCTIQTSRGFYLTAVGGGGRATDVMHTDATRVGSWEKFSLVYTGDGVHYGIRTVFGYWITAVNSGGLNVGVVPDVLHSDATNLLNWEKFSLVYQGDGDATHPSSYGIQAFDGHYLSARDAGGRSTNTFDSDATSVRSWEKFFITCGI